MLFLLCFELTVIFFVKANEVYSVVPFNFFITFFQCSVYGINGKSNGLITEPIFTL